MARKEKRPPPLKAGGVTQSVSPVDSTCSVCGALAPRRLKNVYRVSDVCMNLDCYLKEQRWVGNLPHITKTTPANMRKTPPKPKALPQRAFDVRTGERSAPPQKTRALDLKSADARARVGR